MAQTLGALKISKCATSCLHEQTSTSKKEDYPETQSTKSTKNTSFGTPFSNVHLLSMQKKYGFLRHSVNQVGTLFTHALLPFPPFPSFSFNESIGLSTMALCRAAGSGWKTLSTESPDQAMLLARFPPSHCH